MAIFKSIMLIGLFALIASFTFIKMSLPINKKNQSLAANRITEHYEKLLRLESLDKDAYPPVSAWRFARIGTAGAYLYHRYYDKLCFERFEFLLHALYDQIWHHSSLPFTNVNLTHDFKTEAINEINNMECRISDEEKSIFIDVIDFVDAAFENGNSDFDLDIWMVPVEYRFVHKNPVLPNWGNRPTQIITGREFQIKIPYLGKKPFVDGIMQDALQIFSHSSDLSKEEKWIAEFWSDDVRGLTFSPVGRWFSITNQIIRKEETSIQDVISLYFKLGLSLYDSGIIVWRAKYHFNLQRPSEFIQNHFSHHWKPLHENPAFPAYPSGHAVFGAVAVQVLEHYYGKSYAFTDRSHLGRIEFLGKERSYLNLAEMAKENAYSRIILGVHFNEDCSEGLRIGKIIGNKFIETSDEKLLEKLNFTADMKGKNSLVHEFSLK